MKKIAIIRRNGLGDLLCAYPLVRYLQKFFPEAKLSLFVDSRNAPLVPYLPPVDEVIVFPNRGNKYWIHYKAARKYRGQFDLAISAKTSPMKLANFFLFWLKAKKQIAYVDKSWHARFVNTPLVYKPELAQTRHQALKGLQTVDPTMKEVPKELYPTLSIPEKIKCTYASKQKQSIPVVLICATTTKESSRIDPKRYGSILNRLYKVCPFNVAIVGQKKDEERAKQIRTHLQIPSQIYFPRNFDEFMVLLDACDLYFVGDGGVGHIGAALGKKAVVLFGETNPIEWAPLSSDVHTLYHPEHVNKISEQEIFEALKTKLRTF